MDKEIITFGEKFTAIKILFFLNEVLSNKISSGEKNCKHFIVYLQDNYKIKLLQIIITKTSAYIKCYDGQTKWMYLLIEYDGLLKKYNNIWDKFGTNIKETFHSKPVYNKIFLKTTIKSYGDKVIDFHDKEMPKAGSNHTCLETITIDSVYKKDKKFF